MKHHIGVRILTILSLFTAWSGILPAQLSREQKIADFLTVADAYATSYGPYEWKKQTQSFDLLNVQPWVERISKTTNDIDYAEVLVDYVASLNDAHDYIAFPFYFYANLPLQLDIYDGKVLIESVDRKMLPEDKFPFTTGDELVSMDGKPVADWIKQFRKYAISANARSTDRAAASLMASRSQFVMPSMTSLPDSANIEVRRASGALETYEVPWTKRGEPRTTFGSFVSPGPRASVRSMGSAAVSDSGVTDDSLPLHMEPMRQFLSATVDPDRFAILNMGQRNPLFRMPEGFRQRLGGQSTDFFFSGTFQAGGYNIGFIRIPSFTPPSTTLAYQQFENEMVYFQNNTDGLIIDEMRNPGGSVAFLEGLCQRVIPYQFRTLGFEIRASASWVYNTQARAYSARSTGQPDWVIAATDAVLKDIVQANSEPRGRTGALSLNSTGTLELLPHPVAYKKPVMVLADEFSVSGADAFAAIVQDNKRALIYGYRTMGAGGNVVGFTLGSYTEAFFRITQSLMNRAAPVSSPGLPDSNYVENMGVQPDIVADYMTRENLMTGGSPFAQGFTAAMVEHIKKNKP